VRLHAHPHADVCEVAAVDHVEEGNVRAVEQHVRRREGRIDREVLGGDAHDAERGDGARVLHLHGAGERDGVLGAAAARGHVDLAVHGATATHELSLGQAVKEILGCLARGELVVEMDRRDDGFHFSHGYWPSGTKRSRSPMPPWGSARNFAATRIPVDMAPSEPASTT